MRTFLPTDPFPVPFNETWNITDSTKLAEFMSCPRSYFYQYVIGWRPDFPNNHLHFGTCVHKAMEHLELNGYEPEHIQQAYMIFFTEYRKLFHEDTDEMFTPKVPGRFLDFLLAYVKKYEDDRKNFEVLYTEIAGSVSLDGYHTLHFRMDTILRRLSDQMIESREHKTTGTISDQWRKQFPLSLQVGTYTHALYCLFPQNEVKGVCINGLGFKKTKSHLFDFERLPIWKTPQQMLLWQQNTVRWMDELDRQFELLSGCETVDETLRSFPQNPTSCNKYFGCSYHDYCLAWSNPLRHCFEPPWGMKIEFWNPMAVHHSHEMHFKPEDVK